MPDILYRKLGHGRIVLIYSCAIHFRKSCSTWSRLNPSGEHFFSLYALSCHVGKKPTLFGTVLGSNSLGTGNTIMKMPGWKHLRAGISHSGPWRILNHTRIYVSHWQAHQKGRCLDVTYNTGSYTSFDFRLPDLPKHLRGISQSPYLTPELDRSEPLPSRRPGRSTPFAQYIQ